MKLNESTEFRHLDRFIPVRSICLKDRIKPLKGITGAVFAPFSVL
jgi:hypothetical protein